MFDIFVGWGAPKLLLRDAKWSLVNLASSSAQMLEDVVRSPHGIGVCDHQLTHHQEPS